MFNKRKEKVFCIGFGKTGTTTIHRVLKDLNYKLGDQTKGELLVFEWYKRNFKPIIDLCNTAQAFQDVPFCLPNTFIALDQHFKSAKFILTERDSAEQWYNSLVNFHIKLWSKNEQIPTLEDLKSAIYHYKGFPYESVKRFYNTPDNDLYNKEHLIKCYKNHNFSVKEYFKSKPDKLIVINVAQDDDYLRLCRFLNKKPLYEKFPWENKT